MSNDPISQEWFAKMKGKEPFVRRLFTVFVTEEPKRMSSIGQAVKAGDFPELKNMAHSLKGSAATMGAEPLRDCCLKLEYAARDKDPLQATDAFACIETEINRVYKFMNGQLEQFSD